MAARELEALVHSSLSDPQLSPATRAALERILSQRALDPDTLTVFCAQAIVLARSSFGNERAKGTLHWLLELGRLALDTPATVAASRAFFSPGDACLHAICEEFASARSHVEVCVFTITDDRIREAMLAARRRGVTLRVVSDNDKAHDEGSDLEPLREAGVEVRVDASEAHMHHKFAVFDGARLLTGSYNWTRSAANYNHENVLVTSERALVEAYSREFEKLWSSFAAPVRR